MNFVNSQECVHPVCVCVEIPPSDLQLQVRTWSIQLEMMKDSTDVKSQAFGVSTQDYVCRPLGALLSAPYFRSLWNGPHLLTSLLLLLQKGHKLRERNRKAMV